MSVCAASVVDWEPRHELRLRLALIGLLIISSLGHHGEVQCPLDGVQTGLEIADLPVGWMVHYDKPYSDATQTEDVRPGKGECMLMGAKQNADATEFSLVAFADRLKVEFSSTVWENDVLWYAVDGKAAGFSTLTIDLRPGDQGPYQCGNRLSWLLDGTGGYRAGCKLDMENDNEWRKVVMYGPAADRCQQSYCPEGYFYRSDAPRFCRDRQCTLAECCDIADTCRSSLCSAGYHLKLAANLPEYCGSGSCQRWECCDRKPECHQSDCVLTQGYILKPTAQLPPWCQDRSCTTSECCGPATRCADYSCPVGLVPTSTLYCASPQLHLTECCQAAGVCSAAPLCRAPFAPRAVGMPTYCAGASCTVLECCDPPAPTFNVSAINFDDGDLDANEVGGILRWTPPDVVNDTISHCSVYIGTSPLDQQLVGTALWGMSEFVVPMNTPAASVFMVYTANRGGEQATPVSFAMTDRVYTLQSLTFEDLDLDAGELGGLVVWEPPSAAAPVTHHAVYLAEPENATGLLLATLEVGTNQLSLAADTPLASFSHVHVIAQSGIAEQTTPSAVAILDTAASVSDLDFVDNEDEQGVIGGTITWTPPSSPHVNGYRVYLAGNASSAFRLPVAEDVEVGVTTATVPAGTSRGNLTQVFVYTVSSLGEQSTPASIPITEKQDMMVVVMIAAVGSVAGLRAISVVAGTTTAVNSGGTPDLEALERTPTKLEHNPMDVPITGTYVTNDGSHEVIIRHMERPGVRKLISRLCPSCMHPHHKKILLCHAGSTIAMYLHGECTNSWYNSSVLVKKLANNVISVYGLTEKRVRLRRKRRYCPYCFSDRPMDTALRAFAPLVVLLVIAGIIIIWLDDLTLGIVLIGVAVVCLAALYFAKPGSIFSMTVAAIAEAPPARIRRHFWKVVGLIVALLPCAPAFFSGTHLGIGTGAAALVGALLCLVGCEFLAALIEMTAGLAFAVLSLLEQQRVKDLDPREGTMMVAVFLAAALILVKGLDGWLTGFTATYTNIRLPDDPLIASVQAMTEATGLTMIRALPLEAFASGHLEVHMQEAMVRALQSLSGRVVDVCHSVLDRARDEMCGDAFKKTGRNIEDHLKKVTELVEAGMPASDEKARAHMEELHSAVGKLCTRGLPEASLRRCRETITRVRSACTRLEAGLNVISRITPLDTGEGHYTATSILGIHGEAIASIAQGVDTRILTGHGRILQIGRVRAALEVMQERESRIDAMLHKLAGSGVAPKHDPQGNTGQSLDVCKTSMDYIKEALNAVDRLLRPHTPVVNGEFLNLAGEEVSALNDWFTDIVNGATAIDNSSRRLEEIGPHEFADTEPQVQPHDVEAIKSLAPDCEDEDFLKKASSAVLAARTIGAIATVVLEEVYTVIDRAERAFQTLLDARSHGLSALETIRRTTKMKLNLIGAADLQITQDEAAKVLGDSVIAAAVRITSIASQERLGRLQDFVREGFNRPCRRLSALMVDLDIPTVAEQNAWFEKKVKDREEKRAKTAYTPENTASPPHAIIRSKTATTWRVRKVSSEPDPSNQNQVDKLDGIAAEAPKKDPEVGRTRVHRTRDYGPAHDLRNTARSSTAPGPR